MLTQPIMAMVTSLLTGGAGGPGLTPPVTATPALTAKPVVAHVAPGTSRFHSERLGVDRPAAPSKIQSAPQLKMDTL